MTNKKVWLGIFPILLVFGVCLLGCSTTSSANFYNLGNVSEENCALIKVSPINRIYDSENRRVLESDRPFSDLIKIDGQGDAKQWERPVISNPFLSDATYVRVTPGVHTFTITVLYNEGYELPLDITQYCKAGKGYEFSFLFREENKSLADGFITMVEGKPLLLVGGLFTSTIAIKEYDINEKGEFKFMSDIEAARKREPITLHSAVEPNDFGRLVKRQN
jgi:hypothetical protein